MLDARRRFRRRSAVPSVVTPRSHTLILPSCGEYP
ncbi:Uncharacterised protein [Bordetella pertussis]|nr:Uncharacterised protein [Bordetella pertussis]